ncbi:cytidylyltransferase domain-containing protein [Adlercreutzia sp. ZJ138]|uniref:acylneuraminate cytidylyltransferase family protein n=1 Tax=Adlercreutzia sp. ZJ138 TaxID=2709405 RepID=UPI0013EAD240|nr:acylneuraminate cytidylyltransferase family protein [Adlercreutzia sp. ZJ138]
MLNGRKVLALIPARAGSKGIPGKNLADLAGKPLVGYAIEAALESEYIDDVVVSTDGDDIAKVSRDFGAEVPFMRPVILATDTSSTLSVVLHAIEALRSDGREYDDLVLLQPTQPLRTAKDIDGALMMYYDNGCQPLASVSPVDDHPLLVRSIDNNGTLQQLLDAKSTCRRQDMPAYFRINGCIYVNEVRSIDSETSFNDNSIPYIMDRSHSIDIDEPWDLNLARYLIQNPCIL